MIAPCTCEHEFQDQTYGVRMRVFNECKPKLWKSGQPWHRCTVCGKEKLIGKTKEV